MNKDERLAIVERACVKLREHFSSVQIIAVREAEDGSGDWERYTSGKGSIFERIGATREWMMQEDEAARERYGDSDE